jgi:hypothetical protein
LGEHARAARERENSNVCVTHFRPKGYGDQRFVPPGRLEIEPLTIFVTRSAKNGDCPEDKLCLRDPHED